jgi:hypothetical protein
VHVVRLQRAQHRAAALRRAAGEQDPVQLVAALAAWELHAGMPQGEAGKQGLGVDLHAALSARKQQYGRKHAGPGEAGERALMSTQQDLCARHCALYKQWALTEPGPEVAPASQRAACTRLEGQESAAAQSLLHPGEIVEELSVAGG